MHGHPFAHLNADGGNLTFSRPDACHVPDCFTLNAAVSQNPDDRLLDAADKTVDVLPEAIKIDDEIPDKLTQIVTGDFPPSVDMMDGNALPGEFFLCNEEVFRHGATTEGNDGVMLQKQDHVVDPVCDTGLMAPFLETKRFIVCYFSEIYDNHDNLF